MVLTLEHGGLAVVVGVPCMQHVFFEHSPWQCVSPGIAMSQSSQKSLKSDAHVNGSQHVTGVHPLAGHIISPDLSFLPTGQVTFPGVHMLKDTFTQQTLALHGATGSGESVGVRSQVNLQMGAELSCL